MMTRKRSNPDKATVNLPEASERKKPKSTNAERCRAYRQKLLEDPLLSPQQRAIECQRAKKYRESAKSAEQAGREKQLNRERQKRYRARKKAIQENATATRPKKNAEQENDVASVSAPSQGTKLNKEKAAKNKKDAVKLAVKKHRANMHPDKKQIVLAKQRNYYYRKKAEREEALQAGRENEVQTNEKFTSSGCQYPAIEANCSAIQMVCAKNKCKRTFLFKGLLKAASKKTKTELNGMNVHFSTPTNTPVQSLQEYIEIIQTWRD